VTTSDEHREVVDVGDHLTVTLGCSTRNYLDARQGDERVVVVQARAPHA